jgi:phosphotransferase system IIB component
LCSNIRNENPEIRAAVAKSLAKTGNIQSENAYQAAIASEKDEKVKAELEAALEAVRKRK